MKKNPVQLFNPRQISREYPTKNAKFWMYFYKYKTLKVGRRKKKDTSPIPIVTFLKNSGEFSQKKERMIFLETSFPQIFQSKD